MRAYGEDMDAAQTPEHELDSPHINAPVWPWTVAGWTLAVVFMLLFVITWLRS